MDVDRLESALAGRYAGLRQIGEGGMAIVYVATDVKHDRTVAIKVLKLDAASSMVGQRFLKEIRLTARFTHPNILSLFDSGEASGLFYYVAPYIEGESLRTRLVRERQLPIEEAVAIARGVAAGLHYAHEQGVVHRDIKPDNILLHAGQPLIADFGIAHTVEGSADAKLTADGTSVGSPAYMSPEQITGEQVDSRSDVYSLGCVTYEMIAGEPPFSASNVQSMFVKVVTERPTRLGLLRSTAPPSVTAAVHRALEKAPADRFATAAAFAAALTAKRPLPFVNRSSAVKVGLAGVAVASIIGAALLYPGGRTSPASTSRAHTQLTFSGIVGSPHVSPDGRSVAILERRNSRMEAGRILRLDLAGAEPVEIARDTHLLLLPKWRPDGSAVLVYAGTSGHTHQHGLYLVPSLGGERRIVWAGGEYPSYTWSPDGQRMAVIDTGLLRIIDADRVQVLDSAVVRYRSGTAYNPQWSPTGDWLAVSTFTSAARMLRIIDLQGRTTDSMPNADAPVWHPRGNALYYRVYQQGTTATDYRRREVDVATGRFRGEPVPVFSDPRTIFIESVWDDGARALYVLGSQTGHLFRVALRPAGPGPEQNLTPGTAYHGNPSLSEDGLWVAYRKTSVAGWDLFVRRVNGGPERRLTMKGEIVRDATWSPDGRQLAYGASTDSGNFPMVVLAAGGPPRRVGTRKTGHGGIPRQFAWSPNGQLLLYRLADASNWMIVNLQTNEDRPLIANGSMMAVETPIIFSPEGREVAFGADGKDGARGIWILSLGGEHARLLTGDFGEPVSWIGNTVLYRRDSELRAISRTGGRHRVQARLPTGCNTVAVAKGGDVMICERGDVLQDIWLLDNFDPPT